jgi:hypothetical protein
MKSLFSVYGALLLLLALNLANISFANPPLPLQEHQPAATQNGSLLRVPQTTGIYFSTMNHTALAEAFFESNAWRSIKDSEVSRGMKKAYRRGRTRGYEDYNEDNPFSQYLQAYGDSVDNFIFKSAWEIVRPVIENEIFIYVDNNAIPLIEASKNIQSEIVNALNLDELENLESIDELSEADMIKLVNVFGKSFGDIECPTMMMGSRLNDPEGFRGLLELLRSAAEAGINELPPELEMLRESWKVIDEKDHYLLTAKIDLAKLPWDEILKDVEDEQLASAISNVALNKQATIALGIVDNMLLLGIARDQDHLINFCDGPSLIDLPELSELHDAVNRGEKITSVSYLSEEYAKVLYSFQNLPMGQMSLIRPLIMELDEIPEGEREALADRIENDIEEVIADWRPLQSGPAGMQYGFTAIGAEGIRGYALQRITNPTVDGSKPLKLATHAGPDTIAFMVQRPKRLAEQYALAAKLVSKAYGYAKPMIQQQIMEAEQSALELDPAAEDADPQVEEENAAAEIADAAARIAEAADIAALLEGTETFFSAFDRTTREEFLPSIDGQEAGLFVEWFSGPNSWHPELPTFEKPLPIPAPALVIGTNNAAQVITAGEEYWQAIKQLIETAKSHVPEPEMNEFELTPPERITTDAGTSFRWSLLSKNAGVDPSIRTGALISDDWIVFNFVPKQARQLIKSRTADLFGPAASSDPSLSLMFYDHRVMMGGMRNWLGAVEEQLKDSGQVVDLSEYEAERDTLQFSEAQLRDALDRILTMGECWKGASLRSHIDSGSTVTEFLLKFEDIAASEE